MPPERSTFKPSNLAVKILVSCVLGTLSYLVTEQILGGGPTAVIWAVFIAGIVLVCQFLLDMDRRLGGFEQSIRNNFERVSAITKVFSKIDGSAMEVESATRVLNGMASITKDLPDLAVNLLESEVQRAHRSLRALGSGSDLVYDGEDRDWLLTLTDNAHRIQAVSLTDARIGGEAEAPLIDAGLWDTDLGQRYLNLQHTRIRKNQTKIERAFIVTDASFLHDDGFQRAYQIHTEVGASVRLLELEQLSLWSRNAVNDFILFDDCLLYEVTRLSGLRSTDIPQYQTRITLDTARIERKRELFAEIWRVGRKPE